MRKLGAGSAQAKNQEYFIGVGDQDLFVFTARGGRQTEKCFLTR
jgi:hypothetical protein